MFKFIEESNGAIEIIDKYLFSLLTNKWFILFGYREIFKVSEQNFFDLELLEKHGKVKGILKKLASEPNVSILASS